METKKTTMKKKVLGAYLSPKIVLLKIELEQGILASSATFTPGNGTNGNYTPEIDNWMDSKETHEIDL